MNYITPEQFLSLDEKVQKVFIDWWAIEEGDLIYLLDEDRECLVVRKQQDMFGIMDYWHYDNDRDELMLFSKTPDEGVYVVIPLFRLDQLWDFIEVKYPYIGVNNFIFKDECSVKLFKSMMQYEPDIETIEKDRLQAFWEVAVIVAGDIGGMNDDKYN